MTTPPPDGPSRDRTQYTIDGQTYQVRWVHEYPMITDPGKFEGEAIHVPYYWGMGLEGLSDRDDGRVYGFDLTCIDRDRFPWLKQRRTVKLCESDQGFVSEV